MTSAGALGGSHWSLAAGDASAEGAGDLLVGPEISAGLGFETISDAVPLHDSHAAATAGSGGGGGADRAVLTAAAARSRVEYRRRATEYAEALSASLDDRARWVHEVDAALRRFRQPLSSDDGK